MPSPRMIIEAGTIMADVAKAETPALVDSTLHLLENFEKTWQAIAPKFVTGSLKLLEDKLNSSLPSLSIDTGVTPKLFTPKGDIVDGPHTEGLRFSRTLRSTADDWLSGAERVNLKKRAPSK